MAEFLHALAQYDFLRNALLAGLLASFACGTVGTYVVTRRITYLAGGIAHCVLGGLGFARYMQVVHGWHFLHPLFGAAGAALLAALVIGWIDLHARERIDTVISAFWGIGMATGVLFIARTPGYGEDLMGYLFGDILLVSSSDLIVLAALDVLIAVILLLFHRQIAAVCFDEQFVFLRGLPAHRYYYLLLLLTALAVVLLISTVGIVMVIVLLTLPAALAGRFFHRLPAIMTAAVLLSMFFSIAGLAVSYRPDLPAGAVTILLAGSAYLLSLLYQKER